MEDRTFELLEKLYVEMQDMNADMNDMKGNMATKDDLNDLKTGLKHDIVRLEDKMDTNHKALYDGYKLTYEKLERLEDKVDNISNKVDAHEVEIRVIKGGK